MAAVSNVVLNDGQATPVAHTFSPARTMSDMAQFEDRASGIYIGYNKLTLNLERPTGPGGSATRNLKLKIKIETPKLETVSNNTFSGIAPAPTISYRPVAEITATLPERCSLQDRKDLRAFLTNFLSSTTAQLAFESFELPY